MRPISIRLDAATEQALQRIARRRSTSRSEIVRQALRELIAREDLSPYERVADLVGCVETGPSDLSERTGQKLRTLLTKQRPASENIQ